MSKKKSKPINEAPPNLSPYSNDIGFIDICLIRAYKLDRILLISGSKVGGTWSRK